jgi:hypothetical protein
MSLLDFNNENQTANPNLGMGLLGLSILRGQQVNPLQMAYLLSSFNQQPQSENTNPFPRLDQTTAGQASINPMPTNDNITNIANAIARLESGGKYDAMGPATKSGDRAYGKYQIMGNNIGPWSREALGREVTPQEFLANPQLQDQIAQHRMAQYYNKYGNPQDVAAMWFSGRPLANNNSHDVLGTSVPDYVSKVTKYLQY